MPVLAHTKALVQIAYIVRDPTSGHKDMIARVLDVVAQALGRLPDRTALIAGMARLVDVKTALALPGSGQVEHLDCDTARALALDVYPYLIEADDALDEMVDALTAASVKVLQTDFVGTVDDERHMVWWRAGALQRLPPRDRILCGRGATMAAAREDLIRKTEDMTGIRIALVGQP